MEWQIIVALVIAIPIILFPVALIWYINFGGIVAAFKRARERRSVRENTGSLTEDIRQELEYETALTDMLERDLLNKE
jgi:hypothetical protein